MTQNIDSFPIKLIDNWLHPLYESKEVCGIMFVNSWYMASLICGTATKRFDTGFETSQNNSIDILISDGILEAEIFEETLIRCYENNAEYLQLVNATQEVFENNGMSLDI